jgi:hypothetical protein
MSSEFHFPESALAILRRTRCDANAHYWYDGMSNCPIWDDEFPLTALIECALRDNWAFRFVLLYRSSLILGKPREEIRASWDQLALECPQWPGFRPERRSTEFVRWLKVERKRFMAEVRAAFKCDGPKSR